MHAEGINAKKTQAGFEFSRVGTLPAHAKARKHSKPVGNIAYSLRLTGNEGLRELTNISLRPLHRWPPSQQAPPRETSLSTNRGAAHSVELGLHRGEHRRVVLERREQLSEELHQEVVLVRAPVDVEQSVDEVTLLGRDEHGALVRSQVYVMAVGVVVVHGGRKGDALGILGEVGPGEHAAVEVLVVLLQAAEALLGEGQVDVVDLSGADFDARGGVHAVRRARRVGLRASPAASRGSLCGGSGGGSSQ